MLSIGWFSTGRGEGSRGLLKFVQDRILQGEIEAQIQFVFSNQEHGEAEGSDLFLSLVKSCHLPLVTFSSTQFLRSVGGDLASHRIDYDKEVVSRLVAFKPDICVLAGYMLIVGPEMCRRYTLLNLHPALPDGPKGTWQSVIWSLIESRAPITGAMIHRATDEVDRGPVVTYFTLSLNSEPFTSEWTAIEGKSASELKELYGEQLPLFRLIRQEEYRREPHLLMETLKAVATGVIKIEGNRVVDSRGKSLKGLCLNREIKEALGIPQIYLGR